MGETTRVDVLATVLEDQWYKHFKSVGPDRIRSWAINQADGYLRPLGAPPLSTEERDAMADEMSARIFPDGDDEDTCQGHESLSGAHMGEAVYCPNDECRKVRL